jgi:hypothetical protein
VVASDKQSGLFVPSPVLLRNAGFVIGEYLDLLRERGEEDEDEYRIAAKVRDALYEDAKATEQESGASKSER